MEDLGALPGGFLGGSAAPYAINDRGAIVGQSDGRFGWSPFLYTDAHGMIDLRDRITTAEREAFSIDAATSINNAGQILTGYNSPTGAYGTVLLTPVWREFDGPIAAPTAEPSVLRRADNRMVSVSVDPHATDEYDSEPICRIVRVVNSQRPRSGPDRDVEITSPMSVDLRASRRGPGDTRPYTITVAAPTRWASRREAKWSSWCPANTVLITKPSH
jgi:probable HAF family extracellular repeat protein